MLPRLALTLALAVLLYPRGASAQSSQPETDTVAPAHVAHVEGTVTLERDGRPETNPLNMPLLSGDRLKTTDGRVEVLFADGSALHMDARTTLDIQSDELVRLIDGRLRISIAGPVRAVAYRVDSPAGSVRIAQPGEYRIALLLPARDAGRGQDQMQLELAVLRGSGEIFTDEGTTPVRAGERAYASAGLAPSYAYAYNSATWDAFDRWSESRRDTRLGVSTQYLPSEVRAYASTFDEDGDWRYEQSYGYVWYPRVAVGWRPYYYGRWAQYPRYGWTWIGADRFAWPTHHYGRWGFSAGAWFWIPANRWAPAYVSWAYAPGYVSWCPLGFDNRPVIGINIFNVRPGYYSSSRAWTAIGYSHFGRDYVHRRAVDWDRFDRTRRPSFQAGRSAPGLSRDIAVPRGSTPIRWAGPRNPPSDSGSRAVAGSTPRYINRGDAIVRSRTEQPSAPAQQPGIAGRPAGAAVPREGAIQRTAPGGPARRIDDGGAGAVPGRSPVDRSRRADSGFDLPAYRPGYTGSGRAMPRPSTSAPGAPSTVDERATPRADNPVYQVPAYQPRGRSYEPSVPQERSRYPAAGSAAPAREGARERAPDPRPQDYGRPQETARPRGGYEPRSQPAPAPRAGGESRQAPPPRAAPAPDRSAPSRGTAVPRSGGSPRGGRGGA